jgi:hypothetical protein
MPKVQLIEKHVLPTHLIRSQAVPEQAPNSKRSYPAAAWIRGRIFWLRRKRLSGSYAALTIESLA